MSKANQKFVQADEAVSPVIGVILMVAITVVLAAVVFVLVSNLGQGSDSSPTISFSKDESANSLTVIQVQNGPVAFDDVTVTVTPNTEQCDWEDVGGTALVSGDNIEAGAKLVCTTDGTAAIAADIDITIVYDPSGSVLKQEHFEA